MSTTDNGGKAMSENENGNISLLQYRLQKTW